MKKDQYTAERDKLINEAEALVNEGKLPEAEAKTEEIKALDKRFDDEAKALANLAAMKGPGELLDLGGGISAKFGTLEPEDVYASQEYRLAFANYVTKGKAVPAKFRNEGDESTLTTDVATVIPSTIIPRIVETIEKVGYILPLITRTSYTAGVSIPTSSAKPVATFVNEGAGSDRQKKSTSSITFSRFKLRCEISMSYEVSVATLPIFEATFVRQVSEAMVKAIEAKIISTDAGATNPKGILAETPASGQALTGISKLTYEKLVAAEAALPEAYEGGAVWCMSKSTFMGFMGMTDAGGQPIARVNYGVGGRPERTLLGRTVITSDYMTSFSAGTTGTIFAFIFNFSDYILNTTYDMGIQRKQDWDTEDMLTKAVMSVDGKVVDKGSLVTLAKA
jgi:HK97 family phage major capsid protein